ncbi:MAG: SDR family oxidoreductase [Planctomycetaceae bacterium]
MEEYRVAVVTGAGSGIGRAVSLCLLKNGFRVVLTGRRLDALLETQQLAQPHDSNALTISTDVTSADSVNSMFNQAAAQFGRIDVLFNNAGISAPAKLLEDVTPAEWQQVVDVNLTGPFLCTQAAFRQMKLQVPMGGRIINNGSVSAWAPRPNSAAYTATKHAITGLTKATSLDGRRYNIACSQIDIGNAATDMTARMTSGVLQANGTTASEPTIDVSHIAEAVLYMARLPLEANVQFMTVMATQMPLVGRG